MNTVVISRSTVFAVLMVGTTCMAQSGLKESYSKFAFNLFDKTENIQMAEEEQPANLVISPLSMQMALGMLMNGACGINMTEILQSLQVSGFTTGEVNLYNKMLIEELTKPTLPNWVVENNDYYSSIGWFDELLNTEGTPVIEIANSMWMDDEFSYLDSYRETNQTFYDAELEILDLAQQSSMDIIDEWINSKTHGMIPGAEITPHDLLQMVLINTTYFKAGWKMPFEEWDTHDEYFYNNDVTQVKTPMMTKRACFKYSKVNGLQAIRLDYGYSEYEHDFYGESRFSMTLFLPEENSANVFDYETWKNSCAALSTENVYLKLPRFKASNNLDLVNVLRAMGISNAFDYMAADFSNLTQSEVCLNTIKQKCIIEVDENGSTAAALTFSDIVGVGSDDESVPEDIKVTFDHPFYFTIEDNATGTILFMGHVRCVEGEINSIGNVEACPRSSQSYDIYGRQLDAAKGLFIRDGKVYYAK